MVTGLSVTKRQNKALLPIAFETIPVPQLLTEAHWLQLVC
ncbi:hypothetical protein VIB_000365 [Vibrio metschnikovii CIP 69.14]|nr:hypothetical protein VIB_000365 [Vibrio metschnikovii CIP 69.14]